MVNSKQLSNKIKSTPKLSVRTRQASAQETPSTCANDDQGDLVITIKKIIKEDFDKNEKKFDQMIKLHLQSTNEHFNKISNDVIEVTKNLEFVQRRLDEELGTIKKDIKKLASNMKN